MMKIDKTNLIELVPGWMREDGADKALAAALDILLSEPGSRAQDLRTWDRLENLSEAELDEIAWELGIDWYDSTMPKDTKVSTIRSSGEIQSRRGTKQAVQQLVDAVFGGGEVLEWFEYDGEPYYFKVKLVNSPVDEASLKKFYKKIDTVKSARARLDEVTYDHTVPCELYYGSVVDKRRINYI